MSFATVSDLALGLLCVAVLVQNLRVMRNFQAIRSGDLGATVQSLDRATAQARAVLADLKQILATDGAANARAIASGESLRDELSVMVGIGNAVAERIMEAAARAGEAKEAAGESVEEPACEPAGEEHRPTGSHGTGNRSMHDGGKRSPTAMPAPEKTEGY